MSISLLSTKLHVPSLRANGVSRPRLTEQLISGLQHPGRFALLSGPAGFGKTTLLSEFVAEYRQPVAWLSLDEADNDPIRFWTYLIMACQIIQPGAGEQALALLRTPQPLPPEGIPSILINDLLQREVWLGALRVPDHLKALIRTMLAEHAANATSRVEFRLPRRSVRSASGNSPWVLRRPGETARCRW